MPKTDKYYSHDITWCSKRNCGVISCERNRKHLRPTHREHSFADFGNTIYCPKTQANEKGGAE